MLDIQGVVGAPVTPRRQGAASIDLGAALEVVDFLNGAHVSGIALLTPPGESAHFDIEDRIRLTAMAAKRARVPLLVNVSHSTLDGAIRLGEEALEAGAAALLVAPPAFGLYAREDTEQYFFRFGEELGGSAPLILYNLPAAVHSIELESVTALMHTGFFGGILDSAGEWERFQEFLDLLELCSCSVFAGDDALFARGRSAGAQGGISVTASVVPELITALDGAIVSGDADKRGRLEARLGEFVDRLAILPVSMGIRKAAAIRKLNMGPPPIPACIRTQNRLEEFGEWFRCWLPEAIGECNG